MRNISVIFRVLLHPLCTACSVCEGKAKLFISNINISLYIRVGKQLYGIHSKLQLHVLLKDHNILDNLTHVGSCVG